MDWRSGSRQNATGSAFRGISTRGRGRGGGGGRGRGVPSAGRGAHTSTPPTESASVPPTPSVPAPPQASAPPSLNLPARPKAPSRRGSHQHPRRAPSLSQLDLPKGTAAPPEQPTTPGGRPQVARRASHNPVNASQNPPSISILPIPSLKLDPSTPNTPGSPRPKPARKRSHNRTRSSSKASTQGQLSAAPSVASLRDKDKETPPHLAMASAPPDVQSFDLRTNIDTLVERVRAMAMAGSAVDRDKDKEGLYTPSEGHIDWAGDEDDSLPDLDDWVRPKSAEPQDAEKAAAEKASEKQPLSPVEEVLSPGLLPRDKGKEKQKENSKPSEVDGAKGREMNQRTEDAKEVKELKATNESNSSKEKESTAGKTKTRGKHNRKKGSASEAPSVDASVPTFETKVEPVSQISTQTGASFTPKPRAPLVHPLPPKPQVAPSPARGARPRGPQPATSPVEQVARPAPIAPEEVRPSAPPTEDKPLQPPSQSVESATKAGNDVAEVSLMSEPRKRAFDPSVDWAKAPWPSNAPKNEHASSASEAPSSTDAAPSSPGKKRAFDPSVDWSKAPRPPQTPSPTRRSPTRPRPGNPFSSPSFPHPHTAPPHGRPRGPFPHNGPPRAFPAINSHTPPAVHTRSQVNSPEPSPRRSQDRDGPTHLRAHSSPQTGPGTRTHASRPVITLDAISRISRTLGVPGATTPPRGQTVEVAVAD